MNPQSLAGKAILITGAASGLGAALGDMLADSGAMLMLADRDLDGCVAVQQKLADAGVTAHALHIDVGDARMAGRAIEQTVDACGRLDVLINNAGTDVTCALEDLPDSEWDRVLRTNLYGPFFLSKYAVRHMKQQGGGQIINIGSTAARRAWPNACAYHASKWGLLGLSHALHAELRPFNIKVTAVLAGGMRTPFLLDRFPDIDANRLQDPHNVAGVIRSLLSLPEDTVIAEIMVLPMGETSWP